MELSIEISKQTAELDEFFRDGKLNQQEYSNKMKDVEMKVLWGFFNK